MGGGGGGESLVLCRAQSLLEALSAATASKPPRCIVVLPGPFRDPRSCAGLSSTSAPSSVAAAVPLFAAEHSTALGHLGE